MSRRRRSTADPYATPWLLREYYGMPVWGAFFVALVVIGVGVLAVLRH